MTLPARILSAWLTGFCADYIAKVEGVTVAEVEATVAKYSTVHKFRI